MTDIECEYVTDIEFLEYLIYDLFWLTTIATEIKDCMYMHTENISLMWSGKPKGSCWFYEAWHITYFVVGDIFQSEILQGWNTIADHFDVIL